MAAGRPKKPTALKKLSGTYRPDREIENEMMPAKLQFAPDAPEFLDSREALVWESVCTELSEMEMLHRVDLPLIASYCSEITNYFRTVERLKVEGVTFTSYNKNGDPYQMANPLIGIKNSYFNNAKAMAIQFGLTPGARTKIAAPPAEREGSFDAMMNLDDED